MATELEVSNFIGRFRTAVQLRGKAQWKSEKNRQSLLDLRQTERSATEIIIRELGPANYVKGPEPDDTEPARDVWVFGCVVKGTETYIKIRLDEKPGKASVPLVWSFHKAQWPLSYPLKKPTPNGGG